MTKSFLNKVIIQSSILLMSATSFAAENYFSKKIEHEHVLPIILNRCSKCHNSQPKLDMAAIPPNLQDPQLFVQENINDPEGIRERIRVEIFIKHDMPAEGDKVDKWSENERRLLMGFINGQTFNEAMAEKIVVQDNSTRSESLKSIKQLILRKVEKEHDPSLSKVQQTLKNLNQHDEISKKLAADKLTNEERNKFIGPSGKIIAGGGWTVYKDIILLNGDEDLLGYDPYDFSPEERQRLFNWFQQTRLEVSPMEFLENKKIFEE